MLNSQPSQRECQSPSLSQSSVPDSIDPVVAWRVWIVGATDFALYSSYYPYKSGAWKGKMFASMANDADLDVGFHAFKSKPDALRWGGVHCRRGSLMTPNKGEEKVYQRQPRPNDGFYEVYDYRVGQVVLWGNIVEHEDGYRAEFAMRRDEWERTESFT